MSRTWTKVKAGVYHTDGYEVESKYDRAVGRQWRLKNLDAQSRQYTWFPTLAEAKGWVEDRDEEEAQEAAQPPARYICKHCGAESPPGIGYVLAPGEVPHVLEPDPACIHPHLAQRAQYGITLTTWDNGRGHSQAYPDGPVKDHLLGWGKQALGLFPELDQVVYRFKNHHSEVTVYRKENTNP